VNIVHKYSKFFVRILKLGYPILDGTILVPAIIGMTLFF